MANRVIPKIEAVLQTFWVGGLWVVGYLVAPILFANVDERRQAGELAGHMFSAINYVGLVCGGLLLLLALTRSGRGWFRHPRVIALLLMLTLILLATFVLQPMMQELKLSGLTPGSEAAARFGQLHGVSSVSYLITSLLGLFLVLYRRGSGAAG